MVIIVQEQQPVEHMKSVHKQQGELVAQTKGSIKNSMTETVLVLLLLTM
jgi:hypothetical protein